MRPNKDGLCSGEGQMAVLFMVSPYTRSWAPSGHFKAEEVCMCSLSPETTAPSILVDVPARHAGGGVLDASHAFHFVHCPR